MLTVCKFQGNPLKLSIFNPKEKLDIAVDHLLFEIQDKEGPQNRDKMMIQLVTDKVYTDIFAKSFQDISQTNKKFIGRQTRVDTSTGMVKTVYEG